MATEIIKTGAIGARRCTKHIHARSHSRFACFHKFTKLAAQTIAAHSRPIRAPKRIAHKGLGKRGVKKHGAGQGTGADMATFSAHALKSRSALDAADQAESLWRPFARRDFKIARPARVLIRERNPCLRALRRLFG